MSVDKTTPFEDVAKALPKLSTIAGLSLLCVDAAGALKKSDASLLERKSPALSDLNNGNLEGIYSPTAGALNTPAARGESNPSDQIAYLGRSSYGVQIYIPLHAVNIGKIFIRPCISDSWGTWGYMEVIKCT